MNLVLIDYAREYFTTVAKTPVPEERQGKFIQVRRYSTDTEYIVFSVRELSAYHANIAERFFGAQGVGGRYNRKRDIYEISSSDWEITGGGMWEMDDGGRALRLFGESQAYGAFDHNGLVSRLITVPQLSKYRIAVNA